MTIVKFKDHFDILLNESMYPTIELNSYYRQMNQNPESSELKEYLGNKIRQAEWVKQCVTQRGKTLMQVSRAILEHQEEFFTFGPAHLNPLRLADIAQELDIHESTVSRAVSKKYLQCSWGVYPMNYFFSRSVAVQESSGNENGAQSVTAADIKRVLREIIEEENKKKPYSDRLLGEKLAERGISISRRTVAKYREEEALRMPAGVRRMCSKIFSETWPVCHVFLFPPNTQERIMFILRKNHLTMSEKSCKIVDVADGAELVRIAADDSCLFQIANAQIAQLVEQRTENPRVVGSIPTLGTDRVTERSSRRCSSMVEH